MYRAVVIVFLTAAVGFGAAPLVSGIMPPLHERPSEGKAIIGSAETETVSNGTMKVCMLRVQFLEDFTDLTTGNGRMNLDVSPPHNRKYFQGMADDLAAYYLDVSGGKVILDVDVYPPSRDGCYTLDYQMMHYGDDDDFMGGVCRLFRDAVKAADGDVDYSGYDAVIVVHAGAGQEADIRRNSPGDIGSVFLTLMDLIYYLPEAGLDYRGIPTDDGVLVAEGMIVPEQESQDGFGLGVLGTLVHEFGHQLGLPDLYDTFTGKVGVGGWDLMGYGQWMMSGFWPTAPSAWCRVRLGWVYPITVREGNYVVAANDTVLKVPLNATEYLLIENRQRDPDEDGMCGVDEHDFGLAGSGILIWHIDETRLGRYVATNMVNVDPAHKGVDLEEADGIQDFDYSLPDIYGYEGSEFDPWYPSGYAWIFSPESEPSSDASWGGKTFVTVEVLDDPSGEMEVSISRSGICPGWPVYAGPLKFGPVPWSGAGGGRKDMVVVTTTTGYPLAYDLDGEGPVNMGSGVSASPVVVDAWSESRLLLCGDDGSIHIRNPQWEEPEGWPVYLPDGGKGIYAFFDGSDGVIAVASDRNKVHLYDLAGKPLKGWPRPVSAPVAGIACYPGEDENAGVVAATRDGRVYRWNLSGDVVDGWPVIPGDGEMSIPMVSDMNRDGCYDVAVLSGEYIHAWDGNGYPLPGFPALLPSRPLCSPTLADPDENGRPDIVVPTWSGVSAVGPAGATLENWPVSMEQDSLVAGFVPGRGGAGGYGFALVTLPDGRICLMNGSGKQQGAFPLSVGDAPVGKPLLWSPGDQGRWRVVAAASNGNVYCWYTDYEPRGWFTGADCSGCNCWRKEDLPAVNDPGTVLQEGSFYVYPNPVRNGTGIVRFVPGVDCSWKIRIFNIAGDLVAEMSGDAPGGSAWEEEWDTEDLAPGVYFVTLEISFPGGNLETLFHAAVIN